MSLFMVKKEVCEWIRTGQKNIELRRGKTKKGDNAVFQCGRNILRRKIIKREESSLTDVLRSRSPILLKKDLRGKNYSLYSN
jgi:ASC-1-like (ASCH) protein